MYELSNESQYLKSHEEDLPLTFSEKKSMMRVFDQHLDNSTKNIIKQVKEFTDIAEAKEIESKGTFESRKETIKMEKILNFAKSSMSEVSKSLQLNKFNQNYKTVPARSGKDELKNLQELPGFTDVPKLTNMMRDKRLKESVIGSEDMGLKNQKIHNLSDSEDSGNSSTKKEQGNMNLV